MSSDRRARPGNRPRRRPQGEDLEQGRTERRDPRRRTAYVPRQGSARPARSQHPEYEDDPPQRRAPDPPRYRPQQPPYRSPRTEPVDDYLDADDYDDRVISDDHSSARPARRQGAPAQRSRRPAPQYREQVTYVDEYGEPALDSEYADDYDGGYDDSFIDEDDWYEEEAAAGAYRPRQRASRRGAPALPRPSISISKPNIPRPVMPTRVKEAALIQDRNAVILLGALLVSVLAMAVLTMNRVDSLAPGFATHISASGLRENIRSESALWQLPLMAGALLLMNLVAAWFLATYSTFSARFLLATSVLVQLLIWVALIRIAF